MLITLHIEATLFVTSVINATMKTMTCFVIWEEITTFVISVMLMDLIIITGNGV